MTILKPCEQMLSKTSYFGAQIFVELLPVKGRSHEFLQNFQKCLSAPLKSIKVLLDPFINKENGAGFFGHLNKALN